MCCIRGRGDCLHDDGGNDMKYLKKGWNRKEGRVDKGFKKEQAGSRGWGGWKPLGNCGSVINKNMQRKSNRQSDG